MDRNITEREVVSEFQRSLRESAREGVAVRGRWRIIIDRADGSVEERVLDNIVTKDGLNVIANRAVTEAVGANSAFQYLIIGTATAAGSLGSVQGGIGEVSRKIGSIIASSNEVAILVATWAGAADGITGVVFGTAGVTNHANSGSGLFGNHVESVAATLADSDFLRVQMEIQVGSHAL